MLFRLSDVIERIIHSQKYWRFRVSQLGALTRGGEFEIKPLTLFCGKNNTGKTWAMYAAYSFLRENSLRHLASNRLLMSYSRDVVFHSGNTKNQFPHKELLKKVFSKMIAITNRSMSRGLPSLFNANELLFRGANFECLINEDILMDKAEQSHWEQKHNLLDGMVIIKKEKGADYIEIVSPDNIDMEPKRQLYFLNRFLIRYISSTVSELLGCRRVFLMPAERNGLQLLYRELSARRTALLHNIDRSHIDELLRNVIRTRYAKVIADYIDWLNLLSEKSINPGYSEIAQELETKIAGGIYRVDREGNIFFTPHNNRGENTEEMELHATSSTVKSMFGLWYYLQHDARPGSVLMIDEPELNLHPASQRILARLLVKMVNRGLYVVASTHSDYIVREINMLTVLNKHPSREELMNKHKINGETISPDIMGAYEMSAKIGSIEPMDMDSEGIDAETLDKVINAQGDASDEIYYSLPKK